MSTEQMAWGLVGGLFLIIGFFSAGWMHNTDRNHSKTNDLVMAHDKEIALLKKETADIAGDIKEIKASLQVHGAREERFQTEIRSLMKQLIDELSVEEEDGEVR